MSFKSLTIGLICASSAGPMPTAVTIGDPSKVGGMTAFLDVQGAQKASIAGALVGLPQRRLVGRSEHDLRAATVSDVSLCSLWISFDEAR